MRHRIRRARHNPDMTLAREAGATLASTVVGAAGALGLEKLLSGIKKGGSAADKDTARYSHKQTAVMLGVGGSILGVLLHVKGIAPRIGKALAAGSVALAGARWVDHKDETYTAARATPGSRAPYGGWSELPRGVRNYSSNTGWNLPQRDGFVEYVQEGREGEGSRVLLTPDLRNSSQEMVRLRFSPKPTIPNYVVPEAAFKGRSGEAIGIDYGTVYNGG
jgi:hypothetical protein